MINHADGLAVCGEAETVQAALEQIESLKPDLAVVDITLKGNNGIELLKSIKAEFPDLPTLVLSMHDESIYAERALRAGARGYVMKQEASDHVMTAIRKVLDGDLYVSAAMSARMLRGLIEGPGTTTASVVRHLSNRELEVLQLIGTGNGTRQIAESLHLSVKTIETHRAHLKRKLKLQTGPELVRFAVEWINEKNAQPATDEGLHTRQ